MTLMLVQRDKFAVKNAQITSNNSTDENSFYSAFDATPNCLSVHNGVIPSWKNIGTSFDGSYIEPWNSPGYIGGNTAPYRVSYVAPNVNKYPAAIDNNPLGDPDFYRVYRGYLETVENEMSSEIGKLVKIVLIILAFYVFIYFGVVLTATSFYF